MIILISCGRDEVYFPGAVLWDEEDVPEYPLEFVESITLQPEMLETAGVVVYDSLLIILGQIEENRSLLHIYSLNSRTKLLSFGNEGRGPGELSGLSVELSVDHLAGTLMTTDVSLRNIRVFSIHDLVTSQNAEPVRTFRIMEDFNRIVAILEDTIAVVTPLLTGGLFDGITKPPPMLCLYNLVSGEKNRWVTVPITSDRAYLSGEYHDRAYTGIFGNRSITSYDNSILFLSYKFTDLVETYDRSLNLMGRSHGPDKFFPVFELAEDRINTRRIDNETKRAWIHSFAAGNEFWAHYTGQLFEDRNNPDIFVFNARAEPVRKHTSPDKPYLFHVDSDLQLAYGINREGYAIYSYSTGK